ncbi:MAG: hypothetical protein H7832_06890 [Magnetococcus sp. DMHC-6]
MQKQNDQLKQEYIWTKRRAFLAAVNRFYQEQRAIGIENSLAGYLFAFDWLQFQVHPKYRAEVLEISKNPAHAYLTELLLTSPDRAAFVQSYVVYWHHVQSAESQKGWVEERLSRCQGDVALLVQQVLLDWQEKGMRPCCSKEEIQKARRYQKMVFQEILGEEDQQRLALVDLLADPGTEKEMRFAKVGMIPVMACSQACRHCMFLWRTPLKKVADPSSLYAGVNRLTHNVLFTGGDLSGEISGFAQAIASMDQVAVFAILLNGAFAKSSTATRQTFALFDRVVKQRPPQACPTQVVLQISFDEFHQEIVLDGFGRLKEKVPIAFIANIVECAPHFPQIQLSLLHKQNALNFSPDFFKYGVFGRLVRELERRGRSVQIVEIHPSARLKSHPVRPTQFAPLLRDTFFVLTDAPDHPIHLMSSTIDAYGGAAFLDPSEYVAERDLLRRVLAGEVLEGEQFDLDPMVRFDGQVSLFSAVHYSLGNVFTDGEQRVLSRFRKDPLLRALGRFDQRLLVYYGEIAHDLDKLLQVATGPHHLFHLLTERAAMRLHFTRRLIKV